MSGDFLSQVPSQPFEAPDTSANEAYAATPPSTLDKLQAAYEEGPTSPTAKYSLSRWLSNSQFLEGPSALLGRAFAESAYQEALPPGVEPEGGRLDFLTKKEAPILSADEVNERYAPMGPDGKRASITDKPLPQPVAESLGESKAAQIEREGIFRRYENSHGWLVNRATDMATMLDPLNLASMMVPGLGEEAFLGQFARIGLEGSVLARTLARVGAGATAGAAGMVPIATLQWGLAQNEGTDFGIRDFMSDVAMGAAFGAVIHGGVVGGYREFRYMRSGRAIGPGFPKGVTNEEVLGLRAAGGEGATALLPGVSQEIPSGRNAPVGEAPVRENGEPFRPRNEDEFHADVGDTLDARLGGYGLTREDTAGLHEHYERRPGEAPDQALDRAIDEWVDKRTQDELGRLTVDKEQLDSDLDEFLRAYQSDYERGGVSALPQEGQPIWGQRGFHQGAPVGFAGGAEPIVRRPYAVPEIPFGSGEAAMRPEPGPLFQADPQTRHAAMGVAVSQLVDGQPIDVLPLFAGRDTAADVAAKQRDALRNGTAQGMPQAEFDAAKEAMYPEEANAEPKGPETLGASVGAREGGGAAARAGGAAAKARVAPAAGGGRGAERGAATGAAGGRAGGRGGAEGAAGKQAELETERTAQGEQTLLPGVNPITDRERAQMGMEAPLKGGEAKPPEGGLFDTEARAQQDMFDKVAKTDPDLALALQQLQGKELHPDDRAEIEAATAEVAKAEKLEDAYTQAAGCIVEGGG